MLKKVIFNIYSALCLAILAFILLIIAVSIYLYLPDKYLDHDRYFIIDKGSSFKTVTQKLHQEEIIQYPKIFYYTARLVKGYNFKVHHGEYLFTKNSSWQEIINKINGGQVHLRQLTIAEGLSADSVIKILNQNQYLSGDIDKSTVKEGWLLPETYYYHYQEQRSELITRMQDAMIKTIDELWEQRDANILLKNKQEAIILASIVEKETGIAHERPLIASVFVNRLKKGMRLQSDPTIIYSFAFGNVDLEREIRRSDINNKSAINTYNIYGLPPTPICNPGIDSIKAVLNPPQTDYVYFVAKGDGSGEHNFSSNITDHNNYVTQYRQSLND